MLEERSRKMIQLIKEKKKEKLQLKEGLGNSVNERNI